MKKAVAGIVMFGLVSCSSILVAVGIRRQLAGDPYEPEVAMSGQCLGQKSIAFLFGMDIVTAERARSLAAEAGVGVCIDVKPPNQASRTSYLKIYAWPKIEHHAFSVLAFDEEISHEALMDNATNEPLLPDPNWMGKTIGSLEPHPPSNVVGIIEHALNTSQYRKVARGRKPTYYVIAQRKPLVVWGPQHPYDIYFRFRQKEMQKFEVVPGLGLAYVGRLDPNELPRELDEWNFHETVRRALRPRNLARQPQVPIAGRKAIGPVLPSNQGSKR